MQLSGGTHTQSIAGCRNERAIRAVLVCSVPLEERFSLLEREGCSA